MIRRIQAVYSVIRFNRALRKAKHAHVCKYTGKKRILHPLLLWSALLIGAALAFYQNYKHGRAATLEEKVISIIRTSVI